MQKSNAYVLLEDGTRFDGDSVGADGHATGEVVFTTGMSGYQESMTDPSLRRPAHHLHLPAHRQLRRLAEPRWSPRRVWAPRGDHARGGQPRGRARGRARLAATG